MGVSTPCSPELGWPLQTEGAFCGESKQTWLAPHRIHLAGRPGQSAKMSGRVGRVALLSSQQGLAADQVREVLTP